MSNKAAGEGPEHEEPGRNAAPDTSAPHVTRRKASFAATMKAVLWSFFGVRKRSDYEQDAAQLNPVHVLVAGVIGAALFIALLVTIVKWVVAK